jgi:hypothetical protein
MARSLPARSCCPARNGRCSSPTTIPDSSTGPATKPTPRGCGRTGGLPAVLRRCSPSSSRLRSRERQTHRPTRRPFHHRRHHTEPGMIIDPGHHLRLPQHPSRLLDQPDPLHDVDPPQLHRIRTLEPDKRGPRPFSRPWLRQPLPQQNPVHRPIRRRVHPDRPGRRQPPQQLHSDPFRTPPRMPAADLRDCRLHEGST